MYVVLLALVVVLAGVLLPSCVPRLCAHRVTSAIIGAVLAGLLVLSTSFYMVSPGQVGHVHRVYFGAAMREEQIIALPGQNGPQAEILGVGMYVRPLLRLLYTIEEFPIVSVPNGQYGLLTAKDGAALGVQQFLAAGWPADRVMDMLKAEDFLRHGGQKGTQLTVLQPGQYRLNRYLFDISLHPALDVEAGFVAVIKSNVREAADCPDPVALQQAAHRPGALVVPLVPRGCVGVWQEPLQPGRYYLNHMAYQATLIPTRAQALVYSGGYMQRDIDITVNEHGAIVEQHRQRMVPTPADAAAGAIIVTVEGWRIPLEVQLVLQIAAVQAPHLVAAVGDVRALEDTLITPVLRSVVRDVAEAPGRVVRDLIDQRAVLETDVERAMQAYGQAVGISTRAVRFGDPVLPPELLVVQQRQHLALQLQETYLKEQLAQQTRIEVEKTRAMANQQPDLVRAELSVKIAELTKQAAQKQGEGERLRLAEITAVLGQAQVLQLTMLKEILAAAKEHPEMVKVPTVLVQGETNGLTGPAAILGAGNLLQWMKMPYSEPESKRP
jgi:SPFH domain / Band 7 family